MSLIYKKAAAMRGLIGAKVTLLRYFLQNFAYLPSERAGGLSMTSVCSILAFSLLLSGCETVNETPGTSRTMTGNPTGSLVPSSNVSRLQAWQDASTVASRGEGRASLVGAGESMNPVYGDTTMLVVTEIAYEKLQPGMTVVYINKQGHRVAHQLISKERGGWKAQGINNEFADSELVTPANLVGVVYASMSTDAKD
jgi:hypothetical protein